MFNKLFPKNERLIDRAVRAVLGVVGLILFFAGPKTPWGLLGLVPLVTAIVGGCPLYTVLGVRSCSLGNPSAK